MQQTPEGAVHPEPVGTFAYYKQTTAEKAKCSAAVEYWKGGCALFGSDLPGVYKEGQGSTPLTKPYDDARARAFVALYNAQDNCKAECALLSCPEVKGEEDKVKAAAANATICLTYPKALYNNLRPFT